MIAWLTNGVALIIRPDGTVATVLDDGRIRTESTRPDGALETTTHEQETDHG